MKHVPLLSALLLAAAMVSAHRADAASAEQTLNISFTGVYQGPTTTAQGIETKTAQTVSITSAQVVRAIAFDLGDTKFTTWNGAVLRLSTDFATGAKTFILRKGANPPVDVTKFFTTPAGLTPLDFENRIDDVKVARNSDTKALYFSQITLTGLQTLQLTTSNLTFTMIGFGNGGVINATKRQGSGSSAVTLSVPVVLLRVPSDQPDPGPTASGSFAYNLNAATPTAAANFVSGPVRSGVFNLGNPDTTH